VGTPTDGWDLIPNAPPLPGREVPRGFMSHCFLNLLRRLLCRFSPAGSPLTQPSLVFSYCVVRRFFLRNFPFANVERPCSPKEPRRFSPLDKGLAVFFFRDAFDGLLLGNLPGASFFCGRSSTSFRPSRSPFLSRRTI